MFKKNARYKSNQAKNYLYADKLHRKCMKKQTKIFLAKTDQEKIIEKIVLPPGYPIIPKSCKTVN